MKKQWVVAAGAVVLLCSLAVVGVLVWRPWVKRNEPELAREAEDEPSEGEGTKEDEKESEEVQEESDGLESEAVVPEQPTVSAGEESGNCTINWGNLILINPNFMVDQDFIAARRGQLISISPTFGIPENHYAGNGDNIMMPEAAAHLNEMLAAYRAEYPGHEIGTYSCFRARGTTCGRLCAATGASDHHTGLTCDLIDLAYGADLNSDDYAAHIEWQWLKANSYKYGFIDRFPEAWAGGLMSEPLNVDEHGSTGLYETWHYRYVGVGPATEIAMGKYNNGQYDSLEHYLKVTQGIVDLKNGVCRN